LDPCTLYFATSDAPVQVTFTVPQVKMPARDRDTVALLHMPGPRVTDPRSRSCNFVMTNGFNVLAFTEAFTLAANKGKLAHSLKTSAARMLAMYRAGSRKPLPQCASRYN